MTPSRIGAGLVLALLVCTAARAAPEPRFAGLCRMGEHALISCKASGGRLFSVCASNDLSASSGYLQYRFSRHGRIEMTYPDQPGHPKGAFLASEYDKWFSAEEARLRFSRDGYDYLIFSYWGTYALGDGHRATRQEAGVMVLKGGKRQSLLRCKDMDPIMQPDDVKMLPQEPYEESYDDILIP